MSRPRVDAVVLTYDGRELLEVILPSLAAQTYPELSVLVVDNGSRDDTAAYLRERWPEVRVVALAENIGVTAALNRGLGAADADYVALLNNDMELEPRWAELLVDALERHPEAGSAACKLRSFHEREILDGAGDEFRWRGTAWRRGHGEPDRGQYDEPEPVFGACGGAALYRRAALEQVGLLDERYFAFYEDVDWSLRAQLAGWGCRYAPDAVAYHMGSATLGKGLTDFTRYHLIRNGIWLVAKCYPAGALLRRAPRLALAQASTLARAVLDRRLGVWARAVRDAIRGLPAVLRARREVQRTRRASLAQLDAVID